MLEVSLGQTLLAQVGSSSSSGSSSNVIVSLPAGRLFLGRQLGRIVVGAGVELARVGTSRSSAFSGGTPSGSSASQTMLLGMVGGRFVIARSADERVQALAFAGVGVGHTFDDTSCDPITNCSTTTRPQESNYRLMYEVGPGIRFWFHPQFAIGAVMGLRGDHSSYSQSSDGGGTSYSSSGSTTITTIFTNFNLLGVF